MRFLKLIKFSLGLLLLCSQLPEALAQRGMDQNNINGRHVMAARVERVAALPEQGAEVNLGNPAGVTPLMSAAFTSNGSSGWLIECLRAGTQANATPENVLTLLTQS